MRLGVNLMPKTTKAKRPPDSKKKNTNQSYRINTSASEQK